MINESSTSLDVGPPDRLNQHFKLIDFNRTRWVRGAPAARVEVSLDGRWLWMSERDLRANIKEYGSHTELVRALKEYGSNE